MPLYDFLCKCGNKEERYATPDETKVKCDKCGKKMARQFHSNFGINMGVGAHGRWDENLGVYLRSNAHKRQVMAEQGVSEGHGKGWY